MASAGFVHRVSRALDPHLHSHVVMANLGRGPDGTYTALDGRGLYAHRSAADALYHAQLRHELTTRLGCGMGAAAPWTRRRRRASASRPGLAFSQRAAAIAEHVRGSRARGRPGSRHRLARHPSRARSGSFHRRSPPGVGVTGRGCGPRPRGARCRARPGAAPGRARARPCPRRRGRRRPGPSGRDRPTDATWSRRGAGRIGQGPPPPRWKWQPTGFSSRCHPPRPTAGRIERRGVGERRHVVGGREMSRQRGELEQLLAARGMEMAPGLERGVGPVAEPGLGRPAGSW